MIILLVDHKEVKDMNFILSQTRHFSDFYILSVLPPVPPACYALPTMADIIVQEIKSHTNKLLSICHSLNLNPHGIWVKHGTLNVWAKELAQKLNCPTVSLKELSEEEALESCEDLYI